MPTHEWLKELFGQLAFVSSVLGGFAVAFLGTLLTIEGERRLTRWTMGAAAVSATALITAAVVASVSVAETVRTGAHDLAGLGDTAARGFLLLFSCFIVGFLALMLSVGLSGWIKSRALGLVTAAAAMVSAAAVLFALWSS
jgi:hypothetical protein